LVKSKPDVGENRDNKVKRVKYIDLTDEELEIELKDQQDFETFVQRSLEIHENYKGKYVTIA
jgi:hypothetical protein